MRTLARTALYAGLGLAALTFIYPFLWMVSSTLKPPLMTKIVAAKANHPARRRRPASQF